MYYLIQSGKVIERDFPFCCKAYEFGAVGSGKAKG